MQTKEVYPPEREAVQKAMERLGRQLNDIELVLAQLRVYQKIQATQPIAVQDYLLAHEMEKFTETQVYAEIMLKMDRTSRVGLAILAYYFKHKADWKKSEEDLRGLVGLQNHVRVDEEAVRVQAIWIESLMAAFVQEAKELGELKT
jgi:hypothetical protein